MRTIKALAIIGFAVALVAVLALAASVTIKITETQQRQSGVLAIQVDTQQPVCISVSAQSPSQLAQDIASRLNGTAREDQFTISASSIRLGTSTPGQPCQLNNPQELFGPGKGVGSKVTVLGLTFEIVSLPTLTEWGLIALAVLLAGGMGYMIYRRRPALRPAAP